MAISSQKASFDLTTIVDSVDAGDLISIDALVEDSTESGWAPAEAGRSVSLFLDDDFRAFDKIETNDGGHALLKWSLPARSQIGPGRHVITARLTLPSTGVQLTPDSILFGVSGPDTMLVLAPPSSIDITAGDTVFSSDVPRFQQLQMWALVRVDDATTDSVFVYQWSLDSTSAGCTVLTTGADHNTDPSLRCTGAGTDTAFVATVDDRNLPGWIVERPDMSTNPIPIAVQPLTGFFVLNHD
jgi:hypothetical protein